MRYINMPGEPRSVKFSFGFPLMLAGVERIAPGNLLAMKGMVALLFVLAMAVAYRLARRSLPGGSAIGAALLCLTNPFLILFSHHIMSEMPYLFFSLLALVATDAAVRTGERSAIALATLCVACAILIRPVGLVLGAGLVIPSVLARQRRLAIAIGSACAFAIFLLALPGGPFSPSSFSSSIAGELDFQNPEFKPYVSRIFERDPYRQDTARAGPSELVRRAATSLWAYITINLPVVLTPLPLPLLRLVAPAWPGQLVWALVVLSGVGLGLALSLRHGRPEGWYVIGYLGGVLPWWPAREIAAMPGRRFLVPLVPILLIFLLSGLRSLIKLASPSRSRAHAIGTHLIVGTLLLFNLSAAREVTRSELTYPTAWQSYFEVAEWLKRHSAPDTVVLARKPFDLYLAAERRTAFFPFSPDPGDLIRLIDRYHASYVVIDSLGRPETPRYLLPAIQANPERFHVAFASSIDPPTYLLRVKGQATKGEDAGR